MSDFFLDADVNAALGPLLEAKGHTVRTTKQASRYDASDDEQLLLATDLGMLLITHNKADYMLLACAWRSFSRRWEVKAGEHAGIIVIPQPPSFPITRASAEINQLVRAEKRLWGVVFSYDHRWGWMTGV